jgi:CheY-like chemotaxis protein
MPANKILIIEDNPINLELATDLLELAGFLVLKAIVAAEGIEMARVAQPNLILMDISLPDLGGLAATQTLKADPTTRHIPVIALTAHAMKGDAEKAISAGCAGYLTKPIDTRTFAQTIARFLVAGAAETP